MSEDEMEAKAMEISGELSEIDCSQREYRSLLRSVIHTLQSDLDASVGMDSDSEND